MYLYLWISIEVLEVAIKVEACPTRLTQTEYWSKMLINPQILRLGQPIVHKIREWNIHRWCSTIQQVLLVLDWVCVGIHCLPEPVVVWAIVMEPRERESLHFAPVATQESFQWVTIHHELVVVSEVVTLLSVATREKGVGVLSTLQQLLVHFVSGCTQLSPGNQTCEVVDVSDGMYIHTHIHVCEYHTSKLSVGVL